MELLISMKAEDINTTVFHAVTMMDMPSDQRNGYFIMEIRDMDPETVSFLHEYARRLKKRFGDSKEYIIENSKSGFKIKCKVDETKPYKQEWKNWADFAKEMHDRLENFFK